MRERRKGGERLGGKWRKIYGLIKAKSQSKTKTSIISLYPNHSKCHLTPFLPFLYSNARNVTCTLSFRLRNVEN